MIVHSIYDDLQISVPEDAHKLAGFRAWVTSDEFPERGRICYMERIRDRIGGWQYTLLAREST